MKHSSYICEHSGSLQRIGDRSSPIFSNKKSELTVWAKWIKVRSTDALGSDEPLKNINIGFAEAAKLQYFSLWRPATLIYFIPSSEKWKSSPKIIIVIYSVLMCEAVSAWICWPSDNGAFEASTTDAVSLERHLVMRVERGMGVLKPKIYGVEHSGCITIWVYAPNLPFCVWLRSDGVAFCSAQCIAGGMNCLFGRNPATVNK